MSYIARTSRPAVLIYILDISGRVLCYLCTQNLPSCCTFLLSDSMQLRIQATGKIKLSTAAIKQTVAQQSMVGLLLASGLTGKPLFPSYCTLDLQLPAICVVGHSRRSCLHAALLLQMSACNVLAICHD